LRFRLQDTSTSATCVADGWHIDDVEIRESDIDTLPPNTSGGCGASATTRYFCDSFESGLANWWLSGQDWAAVTVPSVTGSHALTESPDGNYPPVEDAAAVLAGAIDLTSATTPIVSFWHKLALSCGTVNVEASKDAGLTWASLASLTSASNTSTWLLQQFDLRTYVGSKIKLRFRLQDTSTSATCVADGWSIDDVDVHELN
jgi:hypothetical protein